MQRVLVLLCCVAGPILADIRLSASQGIKSAIWKPSPEYPQVAKQMKVAGKVDIEATVSIHGTVESIRILTGNLLLTPATIRAVKTWKFSPFHSEGQPTKAIVALSFDFHP